MKLAVLVMLGGLSLRAQVPDPKLISDVNLYYYDGTPSLIYQCVAAASQPPSRFYKSSSTLTQVVVTTNSGVITFGSTSYLWIGAQITIAGSATAALNGTYKVTAVSGSTATIITSGVSDGTYNDSTLTLTTNAPLLNSAAWSIRVFVYSGTNLTGAYWAGTPTANPSHGLLCSNRALY